MNGIDISSHQAKIDLTKVPCDFCIVKATQDTGYTNPDFDRAMKQGLAAGKLMGAYHYAGGSDPVKEAKHFLAVAKPYIGSCILALDWESTQNVSYGRNDAQWCQTFLDYVRQETGAIGFLYISASLRSRMATVLKTYHSWIAQYPDYDPVKGYKKTPWNEGAYDCDIRQYTSQLWLSGYSSHLDGNKAYITAEEWRKAQGGEVSPVPTPTPTISNPDLPIISKAMELERREDVKAMQALLNLRLNTGLSVDGYFGNNSDAACRSAQKHYGLEVDGICGPATWAALIRGK